MDEDAPSVPERPAAMETERFFSERAARADRHAFRRILNRAGGEPPRADDMVGDWAG